MNMLKVFVYSCMYLARSRNLHNTKQQSIKTLDKQNMKQGLLNDLKTLSCDLLWLYKSDI